ncbi:MAG: Holliday junction branch migration protein RuvA [Clostridiales Family XIII bacterium]|jgi:Holliday junction DNA helicase RuvA|nr:Holliday junction branch migration protein RuvA [Clostridiales Family XIII bacterium]
MISYIHGKLAYKLDTAVVIDTGGVGYEIFVPATSQLLLAREGEDVRVFTVMIVKEDEMSLYGFESRESVDLFRLLLTVSGVGAKAALAILSAMPAAEAVRAITFGDATLLTRANGIGKKGAERIILELSDKVGKLPGGVTADGHAPAMPAAGDPQSEAIEVLLSLGYSRSEAGAAVMGVAADGLSAEEYVKQALRSMA